MKEVPVEKIVEKIVKVERIVEKRVPVEKVVEKVVEKIVKVETIVEVEKIVEKIVKVEKIVEVEKKPKSKTDALLRNSEARALGLTDSLCDAATKLVPCELCGRTFFPDRNFP